MISIVSKGNDQGGRHGYKQQKPLKIFFSRNKRPMVLKHQAMEPGMTLTYFTARSNYCNQIPCIESKTSDFFLVVSMGLRVPLFYRIVA